MTKVTQGYIDHSGERSRSTYYVPDPTVGQVYMDAWSAADAIHDAIAVVTLCNFTDQTMHGVVNEDLPVIPASQNAQRESALWIQYIGNDTQEYGSFTVPGPDRVLLAQVNTDEVDIVSNVTAAALVLVLEANLTGADGGETVTITRMRLVGRSN